MQVVALLACGHQDKDIAKKLNISYNTVRAYIEIAMDRTGCHSRVELCAWFLCKRIADFGLLRKPKTPSDLKTQLLAL